MSHHVLIVDDNPTNLKLASSVLESAGFRVDTAPDAEQAQLLLERIMPDLILMDIGLPGMGGLDLARMLKHNRQFQDICVVAFTAFAMKGDDAKALEAGCNGYISKPIDTRKLPEQVLAFLHHAGGH
jgi:CheY-like chemotaxis protein